jgi:RNA polymerase sigma factor (sigma-70 family)
MEAQALPRTGRLFLPRSPKVLAAFSDERLVEQVRRGNEGAFEAIYDRHHRSILAFCRHMLASADEAEDAVQQTFISAYDALIADARDIRLKAWLYTIARNRCLSILRARREQPSDVDDVPVAGLSDQVQQRAELRELLGDVRGLPVEQRAALVLSELGDLSHAEVGAIVGCEVAKVKSLVFQARSSLIESRRAREIPCQEIREQLATATGGALRRGPLRKHLRACSGCAEFRDDVMRQRKALAAALPVLPTLGLKKAALSALGIGGGGGAGGAAVGGGAIASLAGAGGAAVKLTAVAVVAGVAVGGGLVLDRQSKAPPAQAAGGQSDTGGQAWPAPASVTGSGGHLTLATTGHAKRHAGVRRHAAAPHAVARHRAASRAAPSANQGAKQPTPARRHASAGAPPHTAHGHTQHAHHTTGQHMTSHHTSPPPPPPPPAPAPPPAAPVAAPAPPPPSTSTTSHGHHFAWGHDHSGGNHGEGDGSGDHHQGGDEHQHGD